MLRLKSLIFCGAIMGCSAASVLSAEPDFSSTQKDAYKLASRALQAEAEGDFVARQRLLQEATMLDAECQLAKSLKNEIQIDGQWLSIDDSIARIKSAGSLATYERMRGSNPLKVEEHYVLGQWCLSRNLLPQAYGHFNRVIQLDPNHSQTRMALGYQWIGGEWISSTQILAAKDRAQQAKRSLTQFGPKLREIHSMLFSARPATRERAGQQLMAITDPSAVTAVEAIFSGPSAEVSSVVIKWLAAVDSIETSQVLTRYALMHPNEKVCRQAAEVLRTRPLFDFVPQLIAMTVSPVATTLVPTFNPDGTLAGYRNAFSQESSNQRKLLVLDSQYSSHSLSKDSDATIAQANIERDNGTITARNLKTAEFLSFVTKQKIPSDAQGIWQWWDRYNESDSQLNKTVSVEQATAATVAYSNSRSRDFAPLTPSPSRIAEQEAARRLFFSRGSLGECFVAGTPVMTQKGLTAIEEIRTGDVVLSRDIRSGMLQWQPVVEGTKRPPEATKEVRTYGQTLRCTGGHLFWVSGKGWTKASELKEGDVLHCAGEPTVVEEVKEMPDAPTFNLLVAENSNYFVGSRLILTHDVTERQATRIRVPGLNEIVVGR